MFANALILTFVNINIKYVLRNRIEIEYKCCDIAFKTLLLNLLVNIKTSIFTTYETLFQNVIKILSITFQNKTKMSGKIGNA